MTTVSPLVESKLERRFRTYDLDGNGVIDRSDFELVARRVAAAFGLPAHEARIVRLDVVVLGVWERLAETADADHDGRITLDEYKAAFARHVLADKEAYAAAYQPFIDAMLDIADEDGDGRLGVGEYVKWHTALMSIPPEEAAEAFHHVDRDGNGHLTREEMTEAVLEYYFSDDPGAPGNWLTGRPPSA
ncbi:Ca2+-binding EF-hand superfamily protein [Saccharothrix tamanrassetensis]|uniref:Ca2+-binding EF-hand superfamily protein n=1 Tax=Saccharothrix tamanrassetensis TaxID=1051531 RepID=A0A841CBU1_9PSEU|nr:EF-hand domain-containing protein [Saccharothrix tamanrassetensis]MBB5953824.1 Ca2+-binding EF-hand superfamily protein [Saccharothrix tamanrassetensis]